MVRLKLQRGEHRLGRVATGAAEGTLNVARKPATTMNDKISGASRTPLTEIRNGQASRRSMTNSDDRASAIAMPAYKQ
jgi:hypothetical protein